MTDSRNRNETKDELNYLESQLNREFARLNVSLFFLALIIVAAIVLVAVQS